MSSNANTLPHTSGTAAPLSLVADRWIYAAVALLFVVTVLVLGASCRASASRLAVVRARSRRRARDGRADTQPLARDRCVTGRCRRRSRARRRESAPRQRSVRANPQRRAVPVVFWVGHCRAAYRPRDAQTHDDAGHVGAVERCHRPSRRPLAADQFPDGSMRTCCSGWHHFWSTTSCGAAVCTARTSLACYA